MRVLVLLVVCVSFLGGCGYCNRKLSQEDDWWVEEGLETFIEYKTSWDVDLTPDTPERRYLTRSNDTMDLNLESEVSNGRAKCWGNCQLQH